eukprot:660454-Hanusia_phi.AAC.3
MDLAGRRRREATREKKRKESAKRFLDTGEDSPWGGYSRVFACCRLKILEERKEDSPSFCRIPLLASSRCVPWRQTRKQSSSQLHSPARPQSLTTASAAGLSP